MVLTKESVYSMFRFVALLWRENIARLSEIDSRFGDGDHGVTIGKMADMILSRLDKRRDEGAKAFIESLGSECLEIAGGSAGPLYGVLLEGLAGPLPDDNAAIDARTLRAMFSSSRNALFEITKARVGDKTLMDVLIPATEAAENALDDVPAILRAAATAARQGLRETENQVSKFGRARNYGEKTLGTPDVGAISTALLFEGFQRGIEEEKAR
ncbi:MAG: dihydroxyacetone kinase subunit L [Planctomycetota bacterium]|jgi:dihydroxyacetone kinase-like protein|nr:dihydroxyacetone kinase subunit L [Planctomycetota bacterium]